MASLQCSCKVRGGPHLVAGNPFPHEHPGLSTRNKWKTIMIGDMEVQETSIDLNTVGKENGKIDEIHERTRDTVNDLSEALFELRNISNSYGSTISKRWLKKPKDKQKALLEAAWPGIPPYHSPDLQLMRPPESHRPLPTKSWIAKALNFPELNLEDLTRRNIFCIFCTPVLQDHRRYLQSTTTRR